MRCIKYKRVLAGCLALCLLTSLSVGCTNAPSESPADKSVADKSVVQPVAKPVIRAERRSSISASLRPKGAYKPAENATTTRVRLIDRASKLGIDHTYQNGAKGQRLMVEATGGGCGWVDYDRDGFCDLYLTQGGNPAENASSTQPMDRLFRNGNGEHFRDVTTASAVDERGYSQGIAVGDYDEDGFDDLYVTNVGPNSFFHNQGDGTFREIAGELKIAGNLWSSSAAWADIDRDGDLDLYVCNYVDYNPLKPRICHNAMGVPAMCHPQLMEAVPDECYLNQGDGTFHEAARELGLFGPGNKALGVVIADFTGDGWPDIFVANDTTPNFLFVSQDGRHFVESATLLGCAVSSEGLPQANMGVAFGDYDGNGFPDLAVTHFVNEWTTLYQNLGPRGFHDVSTKIGLAAPTKEKLGFGTIISDLDLDGLPELFIANGHIDDLRHQGDELEMNPQLFSFNGRRWNDSGRPAGPYFTQRYVGRGVATADYDADGDLDIAVVHQNAPMVILENESKRGNWLQVQLTGRTSNRCGVGARVVVHLPSKELVQQIPGGTSYCASHQRVLSFGLGEFSNPVSVEIHWPSGIEQKLTNVPTGTRLQLIEPPPPVGTIHKGGPNP